MIDQSSRNSAYAWLTSLAKPFPKTEPVLAKQVASGARWVPDEAIAFIKRYESLARLGQDGLVYPYHDPIGLPTIGYGKLLSRIVGEDLSKYSPITVNEAEKLFLDEIDKTARGVCRLVKVVISDNQFGALVSFAFNVGLGSLQASTLLRKLNRGDSLDEVSAEFLKWNKAGGRILSGLTRRRRGERMMFLQ